MHRDRILLVQDKCLVLQPDLVRIIGRSPAIVLQQIHYWLSSRDNLGKVVNGQRYIHNTLEDWVDEIKTLSLSTLKRAVAVLNDYGLISIQKFNSRWGNRTNWYTINYDRLQELMGEGNHNLNQPSQTDLNALPHQVKMSQPSGQIEPINMETKITNKDLLNNPSSSNASKISNNKSLEKLPMAQEMLVIWINETTPDINPVLNQERARLLVAALKLKFNNSIQQWKAYCQQIASSDYLMGKIKQGFKATIDWVLKFDIIQRIRECQFGVKVMETPQDYNQDISNSLNDYPEQEQIFRRKLMDRVGGAAYKSWFEKSQILFTDSTLEIITGSPFCRDWVQSHFLLELEKGLSKKVIIS